MNYIPKTDTTEQRLELDFNDMSLRTGDPSSNERMQAVQNVKSYPEMFKTSGNPFTRDHKDDSELPLALNDWATIDLLPLYLKTSHPSIASKRSRTSLVCGRTILCLFVSS